MQLGDGDFRAAAMVQVRLALKRADRALPLDEEKEQLRRVLRPYGLAL
jgi:hypothetical protein